MNAAGSDESARPARTSALAIAAGGGALWGALCYSILWDGTPFLVDRRFVESVRGTLTLLPARIALWGVHLAEAIAGHAFDLSRSTWILAAAVVVAGMAVCVAALAFFGAAVTAGRSAGRRRALNDARPPASGSRPSGEA
jgi:hypothetical protein